jgi:hypothetical protein
MARDVPSWPDILRQRRVSAFVGRESQLELFRENLSLAATDHRKMLLFNVWGNAGVGKTLLLHQLRQIANECGALTAYLDEGVYNPAEAMARVAQGLAASGLRMKQFVERYETYRRHQHQLLADPGAPAELPSLLTKLAVTAGIRAVRGLPMVGMAASVVDESLAAEQIDRVREFVAKKIRSHDDVDLVLDPVAELTPRFVRDLGRLGNRGMILFIDTYERTAPFLDQWLRDTLRAQYGEVPGTVGLVIGGQLRLDRMGWAEFIPLTADLPLDVFSETEARQLIARRGIAEERVIEGIFGGVWMSSGARGHAGAGVPG